MSKLREEASAPSRRASPLNISDSVSNVSSAGDPGQEEEIDRNLAERLSTIIESANEKCTPLCNRIRKAWKRDKEKDRDEAELVKKVTPLLEQAEKILNETNGAIRGADPANRLSNKATRDMQDHKATPEEQRVAEALKVMVQAVGGTTEWAKDKLTAFPKAKKDLGPLLDALSQPLAQILEGVALLLAGVLNLVGRLLSGLGLVAATGLDKIYKGLGLDKWLNM
ncbi:hypothetical protein GGX14DRAFT_532678 [Mycena pura]|uniref:DUF6987 domain-containing protein n=1 Tax=Mycena pura TaxID=153505 RepID=A0AAD6VUQ9_9AGAR|nr:hypothetical protein GGX14DRAFT_532678 [Mycena pura]